jgi:hypothetical protein
MTVTNVSPSSKGAGRRGATKFTPQAVQKIKELVAQGISREEIASLLDVTVGSLQVTCSRVGVSLRRNQNGSARYTLDGIGKTIPTPGATGLWTRKSTRPRECRRWQPTTRLWPNMH